MKKIVAIVLTLLIWICPCYADDLAFNSIVAGGGVSAAAAPSCNPATNSVGDKNAEATGGGISNAFPSAFAATADCSGTLKTGYLYTAGFQAITGVVCLYTKTSTAPAAADALVGQSGEITGSYGTYTSSNTLTNPAVTNGTAYWVVLWTATGDSWPTKYATTESSFTKANAFSAATYPACPANLSTGWTENASTGPISAYISIQ